MPRLLQSCSIDLNPPSPPECSVPWVPSISAAAINAPGSRLPGNLCSPSLATTPEYDWASCARRNRPPLLCRNYCSQTTLPQVPPAPIRVVRARSDDNISCALPGALNFNASTCAPCELRHEAVACSSVLAPAPPCCRIPSPHQLRAPLQLARP